MNNKNKRTVKVSIKLEPGQAFVVANVEYFQHMEEVYRILASEAETPQDTAKWIEVADLISYWVSETAIPITYDDEEDWV